MTGTTRPSFWAGIPKSERERSQTLEPRAEFNLGQWNQTKSDFCARIAANQSTFKILLKTKNDHYFLESWIQHHSRIVGPSNLIIFDNMSSNEQVLRTYEKHLSDIPIVQFDENHNFLHSTLRCPELYECLKQSCQFWVFLDTDEFLVLIDNHTYVCDDRILYFLRSHEDTKVLPASWLWNTVGCDRRFTIGESLVDFGPRLAWGKPIIRSTARVNGFVNHNVNLDKSLVRGNVTPNFFVIHLANLFPQQRIDTSINKLVAIGFASPEDTIETIVARDTESVADRGDRLSVQRFIADLKQSVRRSGAVPKDCATLQKGCIELSDRGDVLYPGASESDTLSAFLTSAQPFIHAVLQTDVLELQTSSREQLEGKWKESAASWERDRKGSGTESQRVTPGKARLLALYLPQFYPIAENNRWWGQGFTEWANVVRARPLFPGHQQPHLPANLGFYDLRVPEVRESQADLARKHHIEGFCYWHYWFHGKRLLERPFDEVLASGRPDFPFCLSWANETWSRRWHGTGAAHEVLQEQRYSPEDDLHHIRWLIKAFADPRYVTVNGRPLFFVYKPSDLPDPGRTTDLFRSECVRQGLREPFLVGSNSHADHDYRRMGFDSTLEFEPQLGLLRGPTDPGLKMYDYASARRLMTSRRRDFPTIPCIFVRWDNTPRRAENGIVFTDSTPDEFESGLTDIVRSIEHKPLDERVVIVNAWNEWAEGNHLEPDLQHGLGYLEAVKRVNCVDR